MKRSGYGVVLSGAELAEASSVELMARRWACPYCGVRAGEKCRRRGGMRAVIKGMHAERKRVVAGALDRAYQQGVADAAEGGGWP